MRRSASRHQTEDLIGQIGRRLERYIEARPALVRRALRATLGQQRSSNHSRLSEVDAPFWLLAPGWFLNEPAERVCLRDILFAQFCLFLAIRLHDDLVDGQAQAPWLVFAGDDLLIEAETLLARHVDIPAFWSFYRRAAKRTLFAIAEVDQLQRQVSGMPASARHLYASVSSVLSIGLGAALARKGRLSDYRPFGRMFSDLAIASQLLDDLQDVEEDAARGRLNIAATTFLGSRRAAKAWRGAGSRRRVLTRGRVLDGGADAVIRLARNHAQRAWRTAKTMSLQPAVDYASHVVRHCQSLADAARRVKVEVMFAARTHQG